MNILGKDIEIGSGIGPVADLAAGANTGHRVHMRYFGALGVLLMKGAASAGTDTLTMTLKEHTAASGGTSANLAAIREYYIKSEATLDGDETWSEVSNLSGGSPQATLALTGATYAATQALVWFSIEASALSAGYEWVSVDIADPGAGGTIPGALIYIPSGLRIQKNPARMRHLNL